MRILSLPILIMSILIISCDKNQDSKNAYEEEMTEEIAEAEAEVYEEEAPDINSQNQNSKSLYDLDTIPCKDENGNLILSNIFQLKLWYLNKIKDQDPQYQQSILDGQYILKDPARLCSNSSSYNHSVIEYFSENNLKGSDNSIMREDIMPMIEEEFLTLNPDFVDEMSNKLIPMPKDMQYNGFEYQKLYDYFLKNENRNFFLAYFMLKNFTYVEEELIRYSENASQIHVRPDQTVIRARSNYDEYMRQHFEYRMPYLGQYQVKESQFIKGYISFWLRRILDGSYTSLLNAQEKVFRLYDPVWYGYIKNTDKEFPLSLEYLDSSEYLVQIKDSVNQDSLFYSNTIGIENIIEKRKDGLTIKLKNGELLNYTNEDEGTEDEDIFEFFGYIPSREYVLVRNFHWEDGIVFLIDINDGKRIVLSDGLDNPTVSLDGKYLAGNYHTMDDSGGLIYDISNEPKVIYRSSFTYFENIKWLDKSSFVHGSSKSFYGKVALN